MSILSLRHVSYVYDGTGKKVLDNLTADFKKGYLYGIMGKSGSGKSTLLSLISGFDTCTEGELLYQGENMEKLDRDLFRSRNIGVIFQEYHLLTNATALENMILSMNIGGSKVKDKKSCALELLSQTGINREQASRRVDNLSDAQQQCVSLARAMSHNPDIIIADDPTDHLDGDTEENIMKIFSSLAHNENKCVIIVTHSNSISCYADELWGLNQGKLVFIK